MLNVGFELVTLWDAYSMVITYVWSRYFSSQTVSFLFGIRFKARYLPLALLAMDAVMGGDMVGGLLGLIVGHMYWFLREEWPTGKFWTIPPRVLVDMLQSGKGRTVKTPFGSVTKPLEKKAESTTTIRTFTGTGRKLGSD